MKNKIFNYTTINILIALAFLLIITGLHLTIERQEKIIKKLGQIIEEQQALIGKKAKENAKLKEENEHLWDNYYTNASDYDGEYYE